ncbi:MAG: DNA ligase [Cocleimonas sp.]
MIEKTFLTVLVLLLSIFSNSAICRDAAKPSLMLAKIYHQGINLDEYWVSEKYDGVRALWNGQQLISRGGNIYHAPPWFIENFPKQKLDGELWLARQSFERVVSTVRDDIPDEEAWRQVKYMVFDMPDSPFQFDKRIELITQVVNEADIPWLKKVKQWKVKTHPDLMKQLKEITTAGAEGLMLHRGDSLYRGKRTGDLLKVKAYQDAEAIVIKHFSGKGKYLNSLGALLVKMPSGIEFKIGTGFTDKERKHPPAIGETISYQYHGKTKNGVPRFASFLRIRKVN